MPTVSVIIPLYKSEAFIADAVASVLNQTHADLEVLCIDDCSPDRTAEIVGGLAKRDSRVKYHLHEKNGGAPAWGRNTGLRLAAGQYVTFLDHDDSFEPTKLEELLAAMQKEEVDFICSNIYLANNQTGRRDCLAWGKITGDPKKGFARRLLEGNFVPPNSTLISKKVFDEVGVFDTTLKGADDYDMWYRIVRRFPATIYDKPLATWRYLNTSSISANDRLMIEDERRFYQKIVDGPEWTAEEKEAAGRGIARADKRLANRSLVSGNAPEAVRLYRQSGSAKLAAAARLAPGLLRTAYRQKQKRQREFQPLDLSFV